MAIGQIYVDISQVDKLTAQMREKLTAAQFDKLMRRTLREVGNKAKTTAKREVRKEYAAPAAFVNSAVGSPKIEGGGSSLLCRIVNKGPKGTIGGTFAASGGWYGWNPPPYKMTAKILKGSISVLPSSLGSYGGQPPFRNLGGKGYIGKTSKRKNMRTTRLGTAVYTRKNGDFHAPLTSVSALAVAQMITNKAQPGIESEVVRYAEGRVIHNFQYMFG